ncbi:methyl-accepting chemotaxis protein [Yunchengibacter salinarum]|uniref:methyl-accepting chemotaxis protein n=1 Tax=Yunchengibacter salinarum TaxID=3133399 RepID=UPI0035B5C244
MSIQAVMRIRDWPMVIKIGVAPLFALMILVLLAWIGISGLSTSGQQVSTLVDEDIPLIRLVGTTTEKLQGVDATVYRALTSAASGDSSMVADRFESAKADMADISEALDQLKQRESASAFRDDLTQAIADLEKYSGALDVMMSMLEIDFATAVSMLDPVKQLSADLGQVLQEIRAEQIRLAEQNGAHVKDVTESARASFISLTVIGLLLTVAVTVFIGWSTVRSIQSIASSTARLAKGDTDVDIDTLRRGDELGAIVHALARFRDYITRSAELQEEQETMRQKQMEEEKARLEREKAREEEERQREGDRQKQLAAERQDAMQRLAEDFDSTFTGALKAVFDSADQVQSYAEQMGQRASENERHTGEVLEGTRAVNGHIQSAAGATEELESSINEIARQAEDSSETVRAAVDQSRQTETSVDQLNESAGEVEKIVTLISDIAEQTNLLALNATIEAARAGEAGKGFAVVASEVKNLASQTGKATEEIAAKVGEIQSGTKGVVQAIHRTGDMIGKIDETTASISASVQQQLAATQEIARTVSDASRDTNSFAEQTDILSDIARKNGEAAQTLLGIVEDLRHNFSNLQDNANSFVDEIRKDGGGA